MNRPSMDTMHVPEGDKQLTDTVAEGPSAGRVWVSKLVALVLICAGVYALARGSVEYPDTADEAKRLQSNLRQADLSIAHLPAAAERGGVADWGSMVRAWREKNVERYGVVRLHLFGAYGMLLLGPASLLFAAVVWWRGQFPRPSGKFPLDRTQISMNVSVVVLLAGLRIFDAATSTVMGKTPAVPDLQAFLKVPTQEHEAEKLAVKKAKLDEAITQFTDKKATAASRATAARAVSAAVWDRKLASSLSEADRQAYRATFKELAKKTYAEDETCPVLIRAIAALGDADEAEAMEHDREAKRPAWVDVKRPEGIRCLFQAAAAGRDADVRQLIERGINVNALHPAERRTALHEAVSRRQYKVVELLLEKGAKADLAGKNATQKIEKEYPLHRAVGDGRLVKLLLEKGAAPDVIDNRGLTPLHVAAMTAHAESAELLLARKAKLNALDFARRTPLDIAAGSAAAPRPQAAAMKELLIQHGGLTAAQLLPKNTAEAAVSPNAR